MIEIELDDIQGYIINPYNEMKFSRYVLLQVENATSAKKWIENICFSIRTASTDHIEKHDPNVALNIAFTADGLKALGLRDENIQAFSKEFREGMITEHRQRLLGDFGKSDPSTWNWGNPKNETVHVGLLVFGKDEALCTEYYQKLKAEFDQQGLKEIQQIDGQVLTDNKEHFGFRDGISQPIIAGSGVEGPSNDYVKAGEFLMGYENEYNVLPQTPLIQTNQGDMNYLAPDAGGSGKKDLGRNGSYLVIRQMDQDVKAFWDFINNKTKNEDGSVNVEESVKLSAKMIGRWPSGAPLTKFPDKDPGGISDDNDFGYQEHDNDGLKCPFGSHLRRSNPRDSFEDNRIKQSWKLTRKHRIIRRSWLYGEPIISSPTNHNPEGEVGLLFNCFNADISRQFEFIQFTWAKMPKNKQLYNDPDPIIGVNENPQPGEEQNFTIQACPVNKTISGLKSFVTIRGGAYFFFPSLSALRYISTI